MSKTTDRSLDDPIFLFADLPDELYFFAYGANMNPQQMQKRCGGAKVVTVARLLRYRVGFFGYSKIWDGAVETIVRDADQDVWGVVYELSTTDLERLDAWQDVRMDGTGPYFHYPVRVQGSDDRIYTALLYEKSVLGEPQSPSQPYLEFIIAGAAEHQLPLKYIEQLRSVKTKTATYPVPKQRTYNPESLLAWDCSSCSDG